MGKKFDLSSMMETVSKLDTIPAPEVRMVPLDDILDNKANFYSVDKDGLKDLADSIAMGGLQQYPVVTPHPDKEGKFLLLSGHRRCAAIRMLAEDKENPRDDLRLVPCTVRQYKSWAMAELQLILANSTARTLTSAEISKQAERMEMLLYQLKEEGYGFPGRMRDQVAAACKVSAPKLARLKVIREKLKSPEFLHLFEKDKLPEQAAYALARLPKDFQIRIAGITPELSGCRAELILQKYKDGWRWEPDIKCPDGKVCKRGDAFLRHDLECSVFDMCGGKKCCLECSRANASYSPCARMCSKAQAVQKNARDKDKAAAEWEAQTQTKRYQKETAANARRVLLAAEAAGLPEKEYIAWGYEGATVEKLRAYAGGVFPAGERWHSAKFLPRSLTDPARTVKQLGCSTDYLLGLTDELAPSAAAVLDEAVPETAPAGSQEVRPVWFPGAPDRGGPVVARFNVSGAGDDSISVVRLCQYDSGAGKFLFSTGGFAIDLECTGWWPVPEEVKSDV